MSQSTSFHDEVDDWWDREVPDLEPSNSPTLSVASTAGTLSPSTSLLPPPSQRLSTFDEGSQQQSDPVSSLVPFNATLKHLSLSDGATDSSTEEEDASANSTRRSDPCMMSHITQDPLFPTAKDVDDDLRVLIRKARAAIVAAQRGCELPVSLGRWPRELYFRLLDEFPRHKLAWDDGVILFEGDPIQRAHSLMLRVIANAINLYHPSAFCSGDYNVALSPTKQKIPDQTWCTASAGYLPTTAIEVSWANETLKKVVDDLFLASAAGLNAVAIKGWYRGQSGNEACFRASVAAQEVIGVNNTARASIILLAKAAGQGSACFVWRLGQPASTACIHQAHSNETGAVAWLPSSWFSDYNFGGSGRIPFPLPTFADHLVTALSLDSQGPQAAIGWSPVCEARARQERMNAINARVELSDEERERLLARASIVG